VFFGAAYVAMTLGTCYKYGVHAVWVFVMLQVFFYMIHMRDGPSRRLTMTKWGFLTYILFVWNCCFRYDAAVLHVDSQKKTFFTCLLTQGENVAKMFQNYKTFTHWWVATMAK
jgi:hypothetical protein